MRGESRHREAVVGGALIEMRAVGGQKGPRCAMRRSSVKGASAR
jgi:hypothetical protein